MADAQFVRRFLRSGRPGFYFRIVESGELGVGDEVTRIERGSTGVTVREVWELSYGGGTDRDRIALALEIPTLGDEWRKPMLAKLGR